MTIKTLNFLNCQSPLLAVSSRELSVYMCDCKSMMREMASSPTTLSVRPEWLSPVLLKPPVTHCPGRPTPCSPTHSPQRGSSFRKKSRSSPGAIQIKVCLQRDSAQLLANFDTFKIESVHTFRLGFGDFPSLRLLKHPITPVLELCQEAPHCTDMPEV